MTTVRQYAQSLRAVARAVGRGMGEDIGLEERTERIKLNLILGMVCVLVKLLVDKGLLTDTDVTQAFTVYLNTPAVWPDVPDAPDPDPGGGAVSVGRTAKGAGTAYDAGVSTVPVDPEA